MVNGDANSQAPANNTRKLPENTNKKDRSTLKTNLKQINKDNVSSNDNLASFLYDKKILLTTDEKTAFTNRMKNWPDTIQTYIRDQLFKSQSALVSNNKDYTADELEALDMFFKTALQDSSDLTVQADKDYYNELWAYAIQSTAQELRRYYGLQEHDELPCWRYG